MVLVLLAMLFIGPIQVIWAILQGILTPHAAVRKHFGFYGIGVAFYFFVIFLFNQFEFMDFESGLYLLHFFGGAFALFCYHIWIVVFAAGLRSIANGQEEWT